MKEKIFFFLFLLISFSNALNDYASTITFTSSGPSSSGDGVTISGTTATITKAGSYLVTGSSSEGNVIISVGSVDLNLQNLELSSSTTSPIIVNKNLDSVKIISLGSVTLQDLEVETTTTGECAVIKIKKQSTVRFSNQKAFKLIGKCKNVIKGGSLANIIFEKSDGEYIIDAYQNAISSDNLLQFNGGKFTIITETGDGIKSSPDDTDTVSLGKILVNSGIFNINSYSDAFQAANTLIIKGGTFVIKTENGYTSQTFDGDTMSAKGFKVSNNVTGCEIRVYDGDFDLNTADDAFHSNGNMTLINGNYKIYTKDDGLHAEFHLIIGTKDQTRNPIINILYSYEAIEGSSIRIYSGKINVTATDDGVNAAGGDSGEQPGPGPRPGPHLRTPNPGPGPSPTPSGDDTYFFSVYGGELNVLCAGDGLDSNGNIFIHGGDINVFSQAGSEGSDNEPLDHDGSFTLFDGTLLAAGNKGMEYVHSGITKGNQMYAYYTGSIQANKILRIKNENGDIVKEATLPKTVSYTFFTCPGLTKNYKFYQCDTSGSESAITFSFGTPTSGSDDLDTKTDDGGKYDDEKEEDDTSDGKSDDTSDDTSDGKSDSKSDDTSDGKTDPKSTDGEPSNDSSTTLIVSLSVGIVAVIVIVLVIVFVLVKRKKRDDASLLSDQGEVTKLQPDE